MATEAARLKRKNLLGGKTQNRLDTNRPSHGRTCRTSFQKLALSEQVSRRLEMSKAIENLQAAQQRATAVRPEVGGFPYLAETLRRAGVTRNLWFLPACESLYLTEQGPVVTQGTHSSRGQ